MTNFSRLQDYSCDVSIMVDCRSVAKVRIDLTPRAMLCFNAQAHIQNKRSLMSFVKVIHKFKT
jgi:hypothetical protein